MLSPLATRSLQLSSSCSLKLCREVRECRSGDTLRPLPRREEADLAMLLSLRLTGRSPLSGVSGGEVVLVSEESSCTNVAGSRDFKYRRTGPYKTVRAVGISFFGMLFVNILTPQQHNTYTGQAVGVVSQQYFVRVLVVNDE